MHRTILLDRVSAKLINVVNLAFKTGMITQRLKYKIKLEQITLSVCRKYFYDMKCSVDCLRTIFGKSHGFGVILKGTKFRVT